MKSTKYFKNTIKAYLDKRANEDELFAKSYAKPHKNINDCITYILNSVQRSGCNGFADDEIYSMAVDFYNNDGVTAGKPIDCRIIVNHTIELTAEEKEEARKEAMKKATDEAYSKITQSKKNVKKPEGSNTCNTSNLFNF